MRDRQHYYDARQQPREGRQRYHAWRDPEQHLSRRSQAQKLQQPAIWVVAAKM